MSGEVLEQVQYLTQRRVFPRCAIDTMSCSIGVLAYNEEANIRHNLLAIVAQSSINTFISEIIVVASGCTDNTIPIIQEIMQSEPRIRLLIQERREGKASAINFFLQHAQSPVLVVMGADIIPEHDTLEKLCLHFSDPTIGIVGARPVPVNQENTFIGHAVHLQWLLHDHMARRNPTCGEVVAFRNVVSHIPSHTTVNEVALQAAIVKSGLKMLYEPGAVVYNKGPMTITDFLQQRRRVYASMLNIRARDGYRAPAMQILPMLEELKAAAPYIMNSPRTYLWTAGAIALEGIARVLGRFDVLPGRSDRVLQPIKATRAKEDAQRKTRRICNTQSVIVFHIMRAGTQPTTHLQEDDPDMARILRKLLPVLRRSVRRDDMLSISSTNTIVAVFNADQSATELLATRLKNIIATQRISLRNIPQVRLLVSSHAVSFGQ